MRELIRYDAIIIGAGHNGLVCAAYLAKSGRRVLVLEANEAPGGLASDREFHPGFHVAVAHRVSHFSPQVARDLDLGRHGFSPAAAELPLTGLAADGNHVSVSNGELAGAGDAEAQAYRDFLERMRSFAAALEPFWLKTMPRIGNRSLKDLSTFAHLGLNLRRLGKRGMGEFMRIATLPARDLLDEHFSHEGVKAMLSWDGLIGSRVAPRSPNSAVLAMLYRMGGLQADAHGLITALAASAEAAGTEIRYGAPVERVLVEGSADGLVASGVSLADGGKLEAEHVISGVDPQRTFLELVGVEYLDIGFTNRIRRLRCNGYVAKLHLALGGLPDFTGLAQPDGRLLIAPSMDAIEFAFDDAKYGESSTDPVMEITIPTLRHPSLAPAGEHVLSAHVMYVPYDLTGGWTDHARRRICERAIETIA